MEIGHARGVIVVAMYHFVVLLAVAFVIVAMLVLAGPALERATDPV
jgi:hypothetical protein